jgi:tetratricopeptide (TPR) repeat protein
MSPDQAIDLALHHHTVGRLREAEKIYRQILAVDPQHVDALHFLGVLAHQSGQHEDSLKWINQAIDLGAGGDAWNNLGEALRALDRREEALAAYRKAIELEPDNAEAHSNLGLMLIEEKKFPEAAQVLQKALALNPSLPSAHYNYGLVLRQEGKLDDAISHWQRALALQPRQKLALNNLGAAYTEKWNPDAAITMLRDAIRLDPDFAEAHANLSTALLGQKKYDEAIAAARRAVELQPKRHETHNALGMALFGAKRYDEAVEAFRDVLQLAPNEHSAFNNLAAAYEMVGKIDEWVKIFEAQVRDWPDDVDAIDTLATVYRNIGRVPEAIALAEKAIQMKPDFAEAHFNHAMSLLTAGRYKEGFAEYEYRWHCKDFATGPRELGRPHWDGSDPAGKTILVTTEQGYGDVLQFSRYLPILADRGAKVLVESWPILTDLVKGVRGVAGVAEAGSLIPEFDEHVALLSLPHLFGTTMETIPQNVPYMSADAERLARWKQRIDSEAAGQFKVGLVWGGRPKPDPRRSTTLEALGPLAQVPGVAFFSLQKGDPVEQLRDPPRGMKISDLGADCDDFADTAAAVQNLDLLISIDSAPAHLGGALGARTWTMLPLSCDWRWGVNRDDCPWYPTMRLFRQPGPRDWDSVVATMKGELEKIATKKPE